MNDRSQQVLFEQVAARYLANLRLEVARSTYLSYRVSLNKYWLPRFGLLCMQDITFETLFEVWDSLSWQTRKTAKNNLIPLHGVFDYAYQRNLIAANPAARIRVRKIARARIEPFRPEEKEAILRRLQAHHEAIAYVFFLANFETGARTGELLALTWADYDGKGFTINKTMTRRRLKYTTKTGYDRYTFATRRLRAVLAEPHDRPAGDNIFLNTKGGPMLDADWLNIRWRAALKTAGIHYRRAYNCRHTYATLGLMAGLDAPLLAQQLGHSLEIFHRSYARWIPRAQDEAAILSMEAYWAKTR